MCLATSGPGATNLVTGIATAYMDSIPIVAITCNVGVSLLGKDSFQEIDITGITLPITKHNFIVKDVNNLAATIRKAFAIAKKGRPGPVLIDIPKDVTANKAEYVKEKPVAVEPSQNICETQLDTAVEMIKEAKKLISSLVEEQFYPEPAKNFIHLQKKSGCTGNRFSYGKGSISWNRPVIYRNAWNAWNKNFQLRCQ